MKALFITLTCCLLLLTAASSVVFAASSRVYPIVFPGCDVYMGPLSPDGTKVLLEVYATDDSVHTTQGIFVRYLNDGHVEPIPALDTIPDAVMRVTTAWLPTSDGLLINVFMTPLDDYTFVEWELRKMEHIFDNAPTAVPLIQSARPISVWPTRNPASDSPEVRFTVRQAGLVTAAAYTADGRLARRFISRQSYTAGTHTMTMGMLPAGMYFIRLQANGSSAVTRLTVVR